MPVPAYLYNFFIFHWLDLFEILLFCCGFYYFSLWINYDKQKKLVIPFYALCTLTLLTYQVELYTVYSLLFYTFPLILTLFVIIHQTTLQKNFIALSPTKTHFTFHANWLETVLRSCLIQTRNKQKISCIIEGNTAIAPYLDHPFLLNTPLQPALLDTLLPLQQPHEEAMLWVKATGLLVTINATWKQDQLALTRNSSLSQWQECSLIYTAETDALAFHITINGTFDVIISGKLFQQLTTTQAITLIQNHIAGTTYKKGNSYEQHPQAMQTTFHQ